MCIRDSGCPGGPDSVVVIVTQTEFDMPNAFTPNADGVNDVFRVVNPILYPNFQLQVFNRWGEALFATDDINEGWDGTFNGKPQEVGSYIWLITYNKGIANPEFVVMKGTVTLVR